MGMAGRVSCILLCVVILNVVGFGTFAIGQNWTIGTDGKGRWAYGQYSQTGSNGFFGPYNIDASTTGGNFAPLNGWMGVQNFQNPNSVNILTSGTNSTATTLDFELNPGATFGWASVGGRYKITPYDTATQPGSEVPISPGQWTHWGIGVTAPIGGSIFFGKSYFQRGVGLQFGWNRTQEYVLLESNPVVIPDVPGNLLRPLMRYVATAPIRPPLVLKICRAPTPCPPNSPSPECATDDTLYFLYTNKDEIDKCIADGNCKKVEVCDDCPDGTFPVKEPDPKSGTLSLYTIEEGRPVYDETCTNVAYLKFGLGFFPWQQDTLITAPVLAGAAPFPWNRYDVNVAQRVNLLAYLMWNNDVLEFEAGTLYSASHAGPELAQTTAARLVYPATDQYINEGWLYLRYWNGRFKLRTELDWYTRETRYQRSLSGLFLDQPVPVAGSGSPFAPQFIDSLRFMADATAYFGPMSFTGFYSYMPGPDRRHGILIKKQPFINDVTHVALDPFYPISALLAYRFGGGVFSPGDLSDASVIAGKIEYAIAANLTVSTSYLRATRVSHGYGWGWIRPSLEPGNFGQVQYLNTNSAVQAAIAGRDPFTEQIPAIPARDLGWEVDVGVFWQLLNQLSIDLTLSYWQPGKWFNYACVDKSVAGWDVPAAGNNWGVNPNRSIDPVIGVELAVLGSF